MNILFLTNLVPYPLDNGGKIKSYNTIQMLSQNNILDIFCFYENDREFESIKIFKKKCNRIVSIYNPVTTSENKRRMILTALRSLFGTLPFVVTKYSNKKMKKEIENSIDNKYDLIYIDHLQLGVYYKLLKKYNIPVYLDEHNCENQIIKRNIEIEKNFLKKLFLKLEYVKLKRFETKMVKLSDKIVVLSKEDKELLSVEGEKDSKFEIIPIPIESSYKKAIYCSKEIKTNSLNIMFIGTLSWYPNLQGIEWFIDNVIPKMQKSKLSFNLYIVGKNPSTKLIDICNKYKNINVTGYVEDINVYFHKCDIMIVPIFIGSGMRVKILEGLTKRIPIISTDIGCEGIMVQDNENILIANTEEEFLQKINMLGTNPELYSKLQINGEKLFNEKYSMEAISKKFQHIINY